MPFARIPWWIWLVAASFSACFVVGFFYLPLKIPEDSGISLSMRDKRVASVKPGSPGDTAGVKQGDKIVNVDGRAVHGLLELQSALIGTRFDHPVSVVVLRGSQEVHLQVSLDRKLTHRWAADDYVGWWVEVAVSLIQLLVGLLVLFKRPRDLAAVSAGLFLCSLGTGTAFFMFPGAGGAWGNLPLAVEWLVFPVMILGANALPAPMLLFSLSFP